VGKQVKFKKDGCGWRDLQFGRAGLSEKITVSIDSDDTVRAKDRSNFIAVSEGGSYAAFHMTTKELRKFAKAIIKELE